MIVYLAGPIHGQDDAACNGWRRKAAEMLAGCCGVIDPMWHDYRGEEDENVREIVHGDLRAIERVDALLVMAEVPSWGTAMEVALASQSGRIVVAVCSAGRVSPWLRYHTNHIARTLPEACAYLRTAAACVSS